jgi:hypothetical protein
VLQKTMKLPPRKRLDAAVQLPAYRNLYIEWEQRIVYKKSCMESRIHTRLHGKTYTATAEAPPEVIHLEALAFGTVRALGKYEGGPYENWATDSSLAARTIT